MLLHGRTEFIEKYLETVAALQARGFAVWTMDWRGQGASSRMLRDPARQHVEGFEEYLDDFGRLLDGHVLPGLRGRKLVLVGHSMGGTIGLLMMSRRPEIFTRAILCAPMLGFAKRRLPGPMAGLAVRMACLAPWQRRRYGPGTARLPNTGRPFEGNKLTSDKARYEADVALVRETPGLGVGGATWGWLRAAMRAMAELRHPAAAHRLGVPILMAIAGDERLVDNQAIRALALKLRRGKVLTLAGARHELLRERDEYQATLWAAIDDFLAEMDSVV